MKEESSFLVPFDFEGDWPPVALSGDARRAGVKDALAAYRFLPGHLGFRLARGAPGRLSLCGSFLFATSLTSADADEVRFETERGPNVLRGRDKDAYTLVTRRGERLWPR